VSTIGRIEEGIRVRVDSFEGVVTAACGDNLCVRDSTGTVHQIYNSSDIIIRRLDPPGYPPQKGDVWLDSSDRPWFVIDQGSGPKFVGSQGSYLALDALSPKRLFFRDGKIIIP